MFSTPFYTIYTRDNRYRLRTKKKSKEFSAKTVQEIIKRYNNFLKVSTNKK